MTGNWTCIKFKMQVMKNGPAAETDMRDTEIPFFVIT